MRNNNVVLSKLIKSHDQTSKLRNWVYNNNVILSEGYLYYVDLQCCYFWWNQPLNFALMPIEVYGRCVQ